MANRRRCLGFEAGNLSGYGGDITLTGSDVSVSSTAKRSGDYGLRVNGQSGVKSCVNFNWGAPSLWTQEFHRWYYKVPTSLPSVARMIAIFASTGNTTSSGDLELFQNTDGTLTLKRNGTTLATTSSAISVGRWYRLEIGMESALPSCSLRIDGNAEIDWTTTAGLAQTTNVAFGVMDTAASAFDFYIDDYTSDTARWPGDGRVKRMAVRGIKEDNATWTLGAGSTKASAVSETTPDDDTSYIVSSTTANAIYMQMDDAAEDVNSVNGISWYVRMKRNGGSNGSISLRPRIGDVIVSAIAWLASSTSTYSTFHGSDLTSYSARGPAFRSDYFDDHAIGLHTQSSNATRVSAVWAEYDYKDSSNARMDACPVIILDFEDGISEFIGQTNASSSGTVARDTAHPVCGSAALKITHASGGRSYANLGTYSSYASNDTDAFMNFWIHIESLPSSGYMDICGFGSTATGRTNALEVGSDGSMRLTSNGTTYSVAPAGTIAAGHSYYICFRILLRSATSATDGRVMVYVDDSLVYQNLAIDNGASALSSQLWFIGSHQNVTGGAIVHYDVVTLDYAVRHTRSLKVATIVPDGAGTLTVAGFTASAGSKYQCIDDLPGNDDTDYVTTSGTTGNQESYSVGNISSNTKTVYALLAWVTKKRDGASNGSIRLGFALSSGALVYTNSSGKASTASYSGTSDIYRATIGRGEWTLPIIQGMELVLRENSANKSRVSLLAATIAYTEIATRGESRGSSVAMIG